MTCVIREHIELAEGANGLKPRIAGHRIRAQDVVDWHEKLGMSPDEMIHNHLTFTLADIDAYLACYWDHRDEIEGAIGAERSLAEDIRGDFVGPLRRLSRKTG